MTDMTSIFQLAISILARFEELSVDADSGQDVGYFERARNILTAISLIDWVDLTNLEEIMRQIPAIISSASVKKQKDEVRGQNKEQHKVLTIQSSLKAQDQPQNHVQWMKELSDCCWIFIRKMDNLFKQQIQWFVRQNDKQNRKQKETFDEQICKRLIQILKDIQKQIEQIKKDDSKHEKDYSQISKLHCESEGGKRNVNSQSNSSSCRSLLTEKLKNITTVDNDEENGMFSVEDKIIIKGNWVLREMKGHQNEKGSQPKYIHSFDQESYEANIRSMGVPLVHRKTQKTDLPTRKGILQQIQPFAESKKEKKPKRNESGCARCRIY